MTGYGSNCGMLGDMDPEPSYGRGHDSYDESSSLNSCYTYYPKYAFDSEEELITSAIFQRLLGKALEYKDSVIRELQNEILNNGKKTQAL